VVELVLGEDDGVVGGAFPGGDWGLGVAGVAVVGQHVGFAGDLV
jgi:hypothetical protein